MNNDLCNFGFCYYTGTQEVNVAVAASKEVPPLHEAPPSRSELMMTNNGVVDDLDKEVILWEVSMRQLRPT